MPSVFVATPMYGGLATMEYIRGILRLQEAFMETGIEYEFNFVKNESLITRGRMTCSNTFLKTDYDYFLFIDSDISFKPEHVFMLLDMKKPVAVGVYRMKKPGANYAAWLEGFGLSDIERFRGPVKVDYAGTGFMLIERDVFEKLKKHVPKYTESDGERWAFFQDPIEDGIHLSEDYYFCKRWREAGGEIWMHPQVKLGHVGSHVF